MHLADVLHEKLVEVLPGSVPIIVLILHQQFLVITLKQALSLGKILAITSGLRTDGAELRLTGGLLLLELVLNLLALVPPDIYWVAAFAAAKFASIAGQCCSALEARDLTQATLASLRESLHALPAASIFHDKISISEILLKHRRDLILIVVFTFQVLMPLSRNACLRLLRIHLMPMLILTA